MTQPSTNLAVRPPNPDDCQHRKPRSSKFLVRYSKFIFRTMLPETRNIEYRTRNFEGGPRRFGPPYVLEYILSRCLVGKPTNGGDVWPGEHRESDYQTGQAFCGANDIN